jgi:hypothetical protein
MGREGSSSRFLTPLSASASSDRTAIGVHADAPPWGASYLLSAVAFGGGAGNARTRS